MTNAELRDAAQRLRALTPRLFGIASEEIDADAAASATCDVADILAAICEHLATPNT